MPKRDVNQLIRNLKETEIIKINRKQKKEKTLFDEKISIKISK